MITFCRVGCIGLAVGMLSCPVSAAGVSSTVEKHGTAQKEASVARGRPLNKGDEWEYLNTDMFGKKQTLVHRVLDTASPEGVVEEFGPKRGAQQEFTFSSRPAVFFNGANSIAWFAPHWDGRDIHETVLLENQACLSLQYVSGCRIRKALGLGSEEIRVAAGSYATEKIAIEVDLQSSYGSGTLSMTVWYSLADRRLVRQTIVGRHAIAEGWPNAINDQIELVGVRRKQE